jgi:hypothetical protein
MDLYKVIRTLYDEKKRLDQLIESLEELKRTGGPQEKKKKAPRKRRGRKSMSVEERLKVSERMKQYWALRREQAADSTASNGSGDPDSPHLTI